MQQNDVKKSIKIEAIEKVRAQYFKDSVITESSASITRVDRKGQRHYVIVEGDKHFVVPSVTTIIDKYYTPKHLLEWYGNVGNDKAKWILKQSAAYGTYLHIMFGRLMMGESVILDDASLLFGLEMDLESMNEDYNIHDVKQYLRERKRDIKKDIWGFAKFMYDLKPKVIAIEVMVYTEDYAGCLDFVCEINGYVCILDFKTGAESEYSHSAQLNALASAWNSLYPNRKIEKILNYYCNSYKLPLKKNVKPYKIKERDLDMVDFSYMLNRYKKERKGKPFKTEITFSTAELNLEKNPDELLQEVNIIDEIIGEKNGN